MSEGQAPANRPLRARLPVRITGIVFWGTVLVGLILSLVQLRTLEDEIRGRQALNADRFAYQLETLLETLDTPDPTGAEGRIRELMRDYDLVGVVLITADGRYRFGETPANGAGGYRASVRSERLRQVLGLRELEVFAPDIGSEMGERRKQLLLTMGLLFSAFGFVLQWILQRILTRPFLDMVATAQRFAQGDENARFDERRPDEFGFLGTFFNQALDYMRVQQDELREALTRVRESEAALFDEKERIEVTLHSIGDAVITTDEAACVQYLNPVAERLTGYQLHEIRGRPIRAVMQLVNENTREPVENPVEQCLVCGEILELAEHTLLIRADGEEVAIEDSAAPIRDRNGELIGAVMVFHDVGHARRLARELSYQATHDALTGLYNRREFEERLKEALQQVQGGQGEHAFCYLDLDQFKVVNDTCGHIAGDELLRQVGLLLQQEVRDSDVLARLGGDEFGILLKHCPATQALAIAEQLRQTIRDFRFVFEEHSFEIGVSIGVVAIDAQMHNVAQVYSAADVACYAAKDTGRNRVHLYQPDDREVRERRGEMRWVSRIHRALEEERFVLYLQPIAPLGEEDSHEHHYEVLLRIRDEEGEEIAPMAFIPAAERYNLMPTIDRWVVNRVLMHAAAMLQDPEPVVWALNISGCSLGDTEFLEFLVDAIRESPVPGERFCFEITETAAISNLRRAVRFMNQLKALGCRFALDDFGSGLSSFGYLKNLDVDYLKIDGSFVRDMIDDPIDRAMVEAINNLGHVMEIRTIAEFVESDAIRLALAELGVDYGQGYGVGRPRPIQAVLEERRARMRTIASL